MVVGYNTRCRNCNTQHPVTVDPYAGMQNVLIKVRSTNDTSNPLLFNRTAEQKLRDTVTEMLKETESRVQKILDKVTGGDAL